MNVFRAQMGCQEHQHTVIVGDQLLPSIAGPNHIRLITHWTYSFNTFLSYWTHWSSKMYKL